MRIKDFKIGDRVILVYIDPQFGAGSFDPLIGTKHFCAGTVVYKTDYQSAQMFVRWDNGHANGYNDDISELMTEF